MVSLVHNFLTLPLTSASNDSDSTLSDQQIQGHCSIQNVSFTNSTAFATLMQISGSEVLVDGVVVANVKGMLLLSYIMCILIKKIEVAALIKVEASFGTVSNLTLLHSQINEDFSVFTGNESHLLISHWQVENIDGATLYSLIKIVSANSTVIDSISYINGTARILNWQPVNAENLTIVNIYAHNITNSLYPEIAIETEVMDFVAMSNITIEQ